ncbi:hypothetical protein KSP40_PGU000525 [Platanthera guangdongensis]|uniref:Uncharacterized protein n=1 Tax=Platanthera guangdongensis TaxID=2320717 RepID=A0ABR2MDX8_9ASPA
MDRDGLSPAETVPDKNEWTLIEKLRKPWGPCFACNYGGKLYVMSDHSSYGMDLCSHVDVYSPDGLSWCELRGISANHIRLGILDNKLLLFSLYDNGQYYRTMIYDPAAPPDSEWCWSPMRASGAYLYTVTIKA